MLANENGFIIPIENAYGDKLSGSLKIIVGYLIENEIYSYFYIF